MYEKHHILPRSMGGDDAPENMVYLTLREHFVAHLLLWRIYRNSSMAYAVHIMRQRGSKSSRTYHDVRTFLAKLQSVRMKGAKHPLYGVGHKDSSREAMSRSHKGKKLSDSTKSKMSDSRKGNVCQSKGVYYTPSGVGRSLRVLARLNNCSETTIQSRCKRFPDKEITSTKFPQWVGLTWRELGWYYVPDE